MSLTGQALLVLLITLAILVPLILALTLPRRPRGLLRPVLGFIAMVLAQLLAVAAVGVWANDTFGFYDSWSDLLGGAQGGVVSVEANGSLPQTRGQGRVVALTVNGRASKASGVVLVWLPPQYDQPAFKTTRFPVLMMLPGQPSSPKGVFTGFQFAREATQAIRSGAVQPFVAVFPPLMIDPPRDTECNNVPNGPRAETWLATDVRDAVLRHVRVTPDGTRWSLAGWSTGGFCAAKLLLRHRSEFNAAASIGGYFDAETDPTTGALFGGSAKLRRENSPLWLIRQPGQSDANLLIVVSETDQSTYTGHFYADSKQMIEQTRGYPNVATIVLPSGGHNYTVYLQTLPAVLAWCAKTAGL